MISPAGKSAKDPKREGKKKANRPRIVPPPEEPTVAELPRLVSALAADIAALRAEIGKGAKGKRSTPTAPEPSFTVPGNVLDTLQNSLREQAEQSAHAAGEPCAVVVLAMAQSPDTGGASGAAPGAVVLRFAANPPTRTEMHQVPEGIRHEVAARIAGALGTEPRITIARLLLTEPILTATELGAGANLTTGSLYHHLREMTHASVLQVVSRNRYALTPLGRRALLSLLALAEGETT